MTGYIISVAGLTVTVLIAIASVSYQAGERFTGIEKELGFLKEKEDEHSKKLEEVKVNNGTIPKIKDRLGSVESDLSEIKDKVLTNGEDEPYDEQD